MLNAVVTILDIGIFILFHPKTYHFSRVEEVDEKVIALVPKGKTTLWFFQLPRCGLAVLTHGNQKDPCLSKLYIVGFAIIY